MRFIDLFAGLGGFHKAIKQLGHVCVFASEIDENLQELYKINWGIDAYGDIRRIISKEPTSIPKHDVLCAGFPCQPFSKAGKMLGDKDEIRGTLFGEILKVLEYRRPKYFILENVPYMAKHNNAETWRLMREKLENFGYGVDYRNYSPHQFGIPQHRFRMFIVGKLGGLNDSVFQRIDESVTNSTFNLRLKFRKSAKPDLRELSSEQLNCLSIWQEFLDAVPQSSKLPGFPIWSMEFGATYPFDDEFPAVMASIKLAKYSGSFGKSLSGLKKEGQMMLVPRYARTENAFPDWKKSYIRSNREFYLENKKYLQHVQKKISLLKAPSWQKLEWNVGNGERQLLEYILQFRASGIRVRRAEMFPSLVCTTTQVPIIGWSKRYLTKNEAAALQDLDDICLPEADNAAFKALGNAVNAKIVYLIAKELIGVERLSKKGVSNGSYVNGVSKELLTA